MSWYKPGDVGFAVRSQLADLGHGARLFLRLLITLGSSLKRFDRSDFSAAYCAVTSGFARR